MSHIPVRFATISRLIYQMPQVTAPHWIAASAKNYGFQMLIGVLSLTPCLGQDTLEKLTEANLSRTRAIIERYQDERMPVKPTTDLTTVRANFHVHSELSHDSRGKINNIVAAAKRAKTQVLLFTEHPSQEKDFFLDGHQGFIDGVLCIPGAEMKGLLVYPTLSLAPFAAAEPQELTSLVQGRGGHVFLSHLEERMDWQLSGLTGTEIYNTHADFKKQLNLIKAMKNPLWFVQIATLLRKYPQEVFSALQSYPDDYLQRYDELCQIFPHTGIAANDAHENVGIQLRLGKDAKTISVSDALGEELVQLPRIGLENLFNVPADATGGDLILSVQLDPYEYSLRHAGTYLLVDQLDQQGVWAAMSNGRAFVAFDWLADAHSFTLMAVQQKALAPVSTPIGSHITLADGPLRLVGQSPLSANWQLKRNGVTTQTCSGTACDFAITEPGVYRMELWLEGIDAPQIWILANPFYIR